MLEIRILQTPEVRFDDVPVRFPYRKAEALFYYMALEKRSNREQLAALLWCDETEERARKNLRQTLYALKQALPVQAVKTIGRNNLVFEPDVPVTLDIERLLNKPASASAPQADAVFAGFYVKDAPLFERWLDEKRLELITLLTDAFEGALKDAKHRGDRGAIEKTAQGLISLDPYNEMPHRHLIDLYGMEKKIYKMQQVYDKVRQLFINDLGVEPSGELKDIYDSHMAAKKTEIIDAGFFFGRQKEMNQFNQLLQEQRSKSTKTVIYISGPTGQGKSSLIRQMTQSLDSRVIEAHCYEAERQHPYRAWQAVFMGFGDRASLAKLSPLQRQVLNTYFPGIIRLTKTEDMPISQINPDTLDLMLLDILETLCGDTAQWIAIDDLQWMDAHSLRLLVTLIHYGKPHIGLILGSRISSSEQLKDVLRQPYFHDMPLSPLSYEETLDFITAYPGEVALTAEEKLQLFQASGGNLFLVNTGIMIKSAHPQIRIEQAIYEELLKVRLSQLDELDRRILEGLSLFFSPPDVYMFCDLMHIELIDFFDRVEKLKTIQILQEKIMQSGLKLCFSHTLIREAIYEKLSVGKKRILHGEIAVKIEAQLANRPEDRLLYPELIYHYERSLDELKALKYKILNLDVFFNYTHELYPVLKDGILEDLPAPLPDDGGILETLSKLERELDVTYSTTDTSEIMHLRMLLDHMKGRFLIKEGQYTEGSASILKMLERAKLLDSPDYIILGSRQMVFAGIQSNDLDLMRTYIQSGMEMSIRADSPYDTAIFQRLRGLYYLLLKDYDAARKDLHDSLRTIRTYPNRKYDLHVAAALNYLGEIERILHHPEAAIEKYDQAIALYDTISATRGIAPILTNKAMVLFEQGQWELSHQTVQKTCGILSQSETVWKRASALALLHHLNERLSGIPFDPDVYEKIESLAKKIGNPEEIEFVRRLKPSDDS